MPGTLPFMLQLAKQIEPSLKKIVLGAILTVFLASTWTFGQEAAQKPGVSPEQQKRIEALKAKGVEIDRKVLADLAVRDAAARIRGSVRDTDICARYGGEEFVVILPKTPLHGALKVASRIHESFRTGPFVDDSRAQAGGAPTSVIVTASLGVASYPSPQVASAESLVKSADEALYRAKKTRDAIMISHAVGYAFDAKAQ